MIRMWFIVRFAAVDLPKELHKNLIFDGLHLNPFSYIFLLKMKLILNFLQLFILDLFEEW